MLVCSDVRTDIEKLRWTTTRKGLIAIAALAGMPPPSCTPTAATAAADLRKLINVLVLVVSSIRLSRSDHNEKKRKSKEKNEDDDTHSSGGGPLPDMSFVTLG